MATLFLEPFGGMAGDMLLAALLDLEDPRFTLDDLRGLVADLVPGEARLDLEPVRRRSLRALHLGVRTAESEAPPQRHLADLVRLIEASGLPAAVRRRSRAALECLARAEADVHGTSIERVHFHEVGAVDTLVDLCGAALALERLQVTEVLSATPFAGAGMLRCAHGELPVPPPAVARMLRGRPLRLGGDEGGEGVGERLTPTAAAVLATWVDAFEGPGDFVAAAVGYGAGTRDPEHGPPNVMRVQLGRRVQGGRADGASPGTRRAAWLMEVNLDDMTAEEIGHAVRALRGAGALEVWTAALAMKKDRPGTLVCALAREEAREGLEAVVFELTTTLGVRWTRVERRECARSEVRVEVAGVSVRVKVRERPPYAGRSPFGERDLAPEHDDLCRAAEAGGTTLREARGLALRAALQARSSPRA